LTTTLQKDHGNGKNVELSMKIMEERRKKQAEKSDGMKKTEKPEEHLHKARIRTSQEYR